MSGHGHVTPNADGSLARCGGPAICKVCALEANRVNAKFDAWISEPPRSKAPARYVRVVLRNGYEIKGLSHLFATFLKDIGADYASIETGSTCATCRGGGQVVRSGQRGCTVMPSDMETCPDCEGTGR